MGKERRDERVRQSLCGALVPGLSSPRVERDTGGSCGGATIRRGTRLVVQRCGHGDVQLSHVLPVLFPFVSGGPYGSRRPEDRRTLLSFQPRAPRQSRHVRHNAVGGGEVLDGRRSWPRLFKGPLRLGRADVRAVADESAPRGADRDRTPSLPGTRNFVKGRKGRHAGMKAHTRSSRGEVGGRKERKNRAASR